jgi:hypothetical protein
MRLRIVFCRAALCLLSATPVFAQVEFQPPTQAELKMTSDPSAPGADAEYLYYQEIDDDAAHSQNYYAEIKVFTEKGRDAATVQLPYLGGEFSIGSISGRTIHPDGTVVPLNVKPENLLVVKVGRAQIERKVFTLPSVTVGSILQYAFQLRFDLQYNWHLAPEWQVQQKYFVRKAHFQFAPTGLLNLAWWPHLPPGASVKTYSRGLFTLDLTDIPSIPDEAWMPPINSFLYKVWFYYTQAGAPLNANDFWKAEATGWSKDVDRFAKPTKTIRTAVKGLVSPSDSDLVKAQKLYAAVEALNNTDYSRTKTESERRQLKLKNINRAQDTWTQKSGSSNDIALLYLSMLRAAGLTAYGIKVVDRAEGVFDPSYMSFHQLDRALVILSAGGKEILLDPGEKMCPFGTVSWRHSDAVGFRQTAKGPVRAVTPTQVFGANIRRSTGDLYVDDQGGITGSLEIVMTGQQALYWRQRALETDANELKNQFDRELGAMAPKGVEAHVDHFLGVDQPDSLLMAVVKVKGTLGTRNGKLLILPAFFFQTREQEPFVNQGKRLEPVDMEYGDQNTEQLTYHLPAGMTVEGAPRDDNISWPGQAIYITKTQSSPGQIIVARVLARAFTEVKPDAYPDLRGFYQKVAAADQQDIVLKTAPAAKGN